MDYGYFMGGCWLGIAIALAIFFPLGAKRRASIPSLAWWFCLIVGAVMCMYGMSHSTEPSFAPRITAVGKAYDHVEWKRGRDSHYGFLFVPEGGSPIHLETSIILPSWADPAIFDGRTFRVVYLRDGNRSLENEAIDIEILSGAHTGFHDSYDARPIGDWLGIPLGAALGAFGFFGLRYMKDDETSAASEEQNTIST